MRGQLLKLSKSTKAERRIGEILKRNRIPFKHRWRIGKYEVDFLIGRLVIEVDGRVHKLTNRDKDTFIFKEGYVPVHISAYSRDTKAIEKEIIYLIKANNPKKCHKTN